MAQQFYDRSESTFELDMHGCSMLEGHALAASRIRECYRYGIEELRIIYGSPERATGTLRQAVQEAILETTRCVASSSFRDSYGMFADPEVSTEVRIKLASNPHPLPQDARMVFSAFTSHYDPQRHRHEPYCPLRSRPTPRRRPPSA